MLAVNSFLIFFSYFYELWFRLVKPRFHMDAERFWENVDRLRPEGDLKAFSKDNGLDYVRIVNQRSDCRIPKLEDAFAIANALNVSIEYLITGENKQMKYSPRIKAIADLLTNDTARLDAVEVLLFGEKKAGTSSASKKEMA